MGEVELIAVTLSPPTFTFKTKALIKEKALLRIVEINIGIAKIKITFHGLPFVKSMGLKKF